MSSLFYLHVRKFDLCLILWPLCYPTNQKKPSGDKKQKDGVGSSVSVQAEAIALIKKFGTQGTLKQEVALRMLQAMDEL